MSGRRLGTGLLHLAAVIGALGLPLLVASPAQARTTCLTRSGAFGPCPTARSSSPSTRAVPASDARSAPIVGRTGPPSSVSAFTIFTFAAILVGFVIFLVVSDG